MLACHDISKRMLLCEEFMLGVSSMSHKQESSSVVRVIF